MNEEADWFEMNLSRCSNLSSVEVYDPETNTWTAGDRMWDHEGGVGVGTLPIDTP